MAALAVVAHEVARRFGVIPLFLLEDHLYLAVSNPMDLQAQDFIRQLTRKTIEPVLATRADIEDALSRHYLGKERSAQAMGAIASRKPEGLVELPESTVRLEDEDAPVIKLVNYMLSQAVHLGASDIHLEPFSQKASLRYRVDGILHEFPPPPLHLFRSLVSRIKIISNLDISERRLPQDGRTTVRVNERDYDLRVSIIPNMHGEGVVIRILDPSRMGQDLEDLGFDADLLERYERLIHKPYEILLVVGPTGSGKTTTLYATLKKIYTPRRKLITLEDPVEFQLDGVTQIQVNPDIGFTFAQGLRSILRHDPDVVMLGEIRDLESAEIALRASLTGHLLFSTMHTNDAPLAVTRLVDMGIQAFLVLSSLLGVLAQRLVRRLCGECKTRTHPTPSELQALGISALPAGTTLFKPVGCAACGNLGYKGRVGIYEFLEITPEMRRLGSDDLKAPLLRDLAAPQGYRTLRDAALEKLYKGITSAEEVVGVTMRD